MTTPKLTRNEYKREWLRQDKLKNPEKYKAVALRDREKKKEHDKKYYEKHREKIKARSKARFEAKKDEILEKSRTYGKRYRDNNKEKWAAKNKKWFEENPDKRAAYIANRRAKHRKPKWVDADELFLIREAYDLAQKRNKLHGFEWHVDHIVPLLAKKACGLHTIYNLQVIPAKHNYAKQNKYEVE